MADKNPNIDTVASNKPALVTDLNASYVSKEQYTFGRNLTRASKEGDIGTLGNEPSNIECYAAPYKILGIIPLPDDTHMIFSGDESNSEIGIGDPKKCSYKTVKNLSSFNFSMYNQPITGVAKKDFNKGIVVTFTDKANPIRRVELNKLSKLTNVDDILLFKKINHPNISVSRGIIGSVPNGVYSACIAYSVDKQVFTSWFSITNRIQLFSENGTNAIHLDISNLDTDFTEFSLLIVGNYIDPVTKGATKSAKIVGTYSTKIKSIDVTDFLNTTYQEVELSNLVINKTSWQKAGIITSNSNYLLLGDLVARREENYQLKAMSIEAEYVVSQVPAEYYEEDGLDIGYYRDENYDFYIQGVYTTGELTDKFHVGGRRKKSTDSQLSIKDVYEYDQDCAEQRKIQKWEVENTAGPVHYTNNEFKCGRRVLGYGEMGYFESTDLYPDNKDMFGDDANTPQRFHKMPNECIVPRFSNENGKFYVNILGVRFKKIPKFDSPDIVGYKITRSDRKGGNGTIVARGIMSNVRGYTDSQTGQEIMYTNYTVNDLNPDVYLSSTQTTFSNNKEKHFTPLSTYYKDRFNFYSPHTMFEPRYNLGSEIKIESEETADVTGKFEIVHNHPKQKLLNQFAFWASLAIGAIETYYEAQGLKNSVKTSTSGGLSGQAPTTGTAGTILFPSVGGVSINTNSTSQGSGSALAITGQGVQDSIAALLSAIRGGNFGEVRTYVKILKNAIKFIVSLGATAALTAVSIMRYANEILDTIYGFTSYIDYVYQYNAIAFFNQSKCVNARRTLNRPALYIPSDVVSIDDKLYNNYFREKTVYLELNKEIEDPTVKDTSRNTISGFGICDDVRQEVKSKGSVFYATSKIPNPNQYGRIGSSSPVSIHNNVISNYSETPILYGGDCIITRFQFQKKMQFFNQNLANGNFPPGTEYDYKLYRNIAYPRYWIDSTKYDFSELLNKKMVNYSTFSRTTAGKHNLDCKKSNDGSSITRIDNAYMYLSNNCVLDFFVEADYNPNFRDKNNSLVYSKTNKNLAEIFRSDRLNTPEEFNINRVYSDLYTTEIYAQQQRDDFDPLNPIPENQENSVIYSLPSFNLQYGDNWQYFLPANYFAFRESDFGTLTAMHKLDQDRIIFLFSKSSPYISMGRDFLQLEQSGRKITIGDGGLFAQDPREMMPTDNNYASCNSRFAFSNTHLGRFYPSSTQGRIINAESMDDITRQGISYWCKEYMPIRLYSYFPNYPNIENPISGVGYLEVFDSFNETVYIIKRDYSPIYTDIIYENGKFIYKGNEVLLSDSRYFSNISWTLSYSPLDKAFISWHDWHPELIVQSENHFLTVKDKKVWKHNEETSSFCNFYGKDYPFEWEPVSSSGQQVEIVKNLEYILEVYEYKNSGRNRFHVHHQNFDVLQVSNSEQASPVLNLVYGSQDPEENQAYPKINNSNKVSWDVLFFKEENKYRVNQFWDATKDRGEFDSANNHLFATDESGYRTIVNPVAIDVNKPEEERKKFRHYWNKFRLTRKISGKYKFIFKLLNIKKQISI